MRLENKTYYNTLVTSTNPNQPHKLPAVLIILDGERRILMNLEIWTSRWLFQEIPNSNSSPKAHQITYTDLTKYSQSTFQNLMENGEKDHQGAQEETQIQLLDTQQKKRNEGVKVLRI